MGVIKGDARSLDYSSCSFQGNVESSFDLALPAAVLNSSWFLAPPTKRVEFSLTSLNLNQ